MPDSSSEATWVDLGPADLMPGEHKSVQAGHIAVALFNVNGTWRALEDVCTHDGGELSSGPFEGNVITCPRHGGQFDVETGKALCFPAVSPTAVYPVRVENGRVWVSLE
jgi:3-phenylpropionate/trans-cinnamate dioxygenase ferredoxin subunit